MKKTKKNEYSKKRGQKNILFFNGNNLVTLGQSTSFILFCKALGFSMALGGCSHYIDLCPPPFGYSSKHMESLWCLMFHKLMSITHFMSLFIRHAIVQGKVLQTDSGFFQ
jgi:hypothetical protein